MVWKWTPARKQLVFLKVALTLQQVQGSLVLLVCECEDRSLPTTPAVLVLEHLRLTADAIGSCQQE